MILSVMCQNCKVNNLKLCDKNCMVDFAKSLSDTNRKAIVEILSEGKEGVCFKKLD